MGTCSDWCLPDGLKRARKDHGLTQRQLAGKLFGDEDRVKNIQNWEQGIVKNLTLETLRDLQRIYDNCSLDYLFGNIDAKDHDTQFIMDETGLTETAITTLAFDVEDKRKEVEYINEDGLDDGERDEALAYLDNKASVADFVSFFITAQDETGHRPITDVLYAINSDIASAHSLKKLPPLAKSICDNVYSLLREKTNPIFDRSYNNREKLYREIIMHEVNEHKEELIKAFGANTTIEKITSEMIGTYWAKVDTDPDKVRERQYHLMNDVYSLIQLYIKTKLE